MSGAVGGDRSFTPALTDLLRGRLWQLSALIEQRGERALAGTSLTLPLNHLLDTVVAEPGVSVTQIAARLRKSQQAISQAADRLERLGFIERRVGAGRSVALHATDRGRLVSAEGVAREQRAEQVLREAFGTTRFDALMNELLVLRELVMKETGRTEAE